MSSAEARTSADDERLAFLVLAHALIFDVATRCQARMLLLKGRAARLHGFRDRSSISADVDVFVEPERVRSVMRELERRGWRSRAADADVAAFPVHSTSYFHDAWSCDIDVHFRFPGLGVASSTAFELMWERRAPLRVGDAVGWAPDELDTFILLTLHALRGPATGHRDEERARLSAYLPRVGVTRVISRARQLDALRYLRPWLSRSAVVPRRVSANWGVPDREWQLRAVADPMVRRVVNFLDAGWPERARALRIALVPPRSTLVKDQPVSDAHHVPWRALAARWLRGLNRVYGAHRTARRVRRSLGGGDDV